MIALVALGLPALAFAPDDVHGDGAEPHRVHRFHVERQDQARRAPGWQAFVQGDGAGWTARFDERTGLPLSAWGPPIDLPGAGDAPAVEAALRDLLLRNPGLVGVPVEQLALQAIARDAQHDAWTVQLAQVLPGPGLDDPKLALPAQRVLDPLGIGGGLLDDAPAFAASLDADGVPVWGGVVQLRVVNGRLIWLSARTSPQAGEAVGEPTLSTATAIEVAVSDGPAPHAEHDLLGARLLVLPMEAWGLDPRAPASGSGTGLQHRLVYEVRTRTAEPPGVWVGFVDASSGELLRVYNDVRFVSGTVYATHDTRTVNGDYSTSPLVELLVYGDSGDAAYTDAADGSYALDASSSATASLLGSWVQVNNQAGDEAAIAFSGDYTWTADEATQAELDTYVFLNQVIDWKDTWAPEVSTGGRLRSNVNINSSCNAYFDGSVNFYQSSSSCNNTGRIADVNYHEWGHGFHYYSLESGSYDGSFGEGAADVVSALNTADHQIGPYFYVSGGPVREIATDKVYPDDLTGQVHSDGLIYGSTMWDLWAALEADLGADEGYEAVTRIFTGMVKYGPGISGTYDAAVLADDDNGDLTDGTPNICALIETFGAHGLGPGGETGGLITLSHTPLGVQAPSASSYPVSADIFNMAADCVDFSASTGAVRYSVDGGETWAEASLEVGADAIAGAIPAQPAGTIVHYYLTIEGDGSAASAPAGGYINPYTFVVGTLEEIYCEDFEEDDGGYTHDLLAGTEQEGADDWIHATPRGYADDPDFAASGKHVWGNDLGGGNYNGEYQSDKHNRLRSVPIDVAGHDTVILQYQRWLAVEDGYWDHAELVRIFDEDDDSTELLWTNYDSPGGRSDDHSQHHIDTQWMNHAVAIDVSDGGPLQLGWDIISDGGLEFGGWNIDDVCVYALVEGGEVPGDGGAADGGAADGGGDDTGAASADGGVEEGGDGGGAAGDAGDEEWAVQARGCGCASSAASPASALGLLLVGLAGLWRRRRA